MCHFNLYFIYGLADENIALDKTTNMSSIYDPKIHDGSQYICCDSEFAVDGNKSRTWVNGCQYCLCANTDSLFNQQEGWAVYLQRLYSLRRTDCCRECFVRKLEKL